MVKMRYQNIFSREQRSWSKTFSSAEFVRKNLRQLIDKFRMTYFVLICFDSFDKNKTQSKAIEKLIE